MGQLEDSSCPVAVSIRSRRERLVVNAAGIVVKTTFLSLFDIARGATVAEMEIR